MKENVLRNWHDNGQLRYEIPYLNGKAHGMSKWWISNGQIWDEIPYKNDLQHGAKFECEY